MSLARTRDRRPRQRQRTNLQALIDAGLPIAAVASNVAGAPALARAEAPASRRRVFPLDAYPDRDERDEAHGRLARVARRRARRLAGYMHLLRPRFFAASRIESSTCIPAPLPAFPGAHAVEDALAAGVAETAATVHLVDEGVDTGPRHPAGARRRSSRETRPRACTRGSRRSSIACCPRS